MRYIDILVNFEREINKFNSPFDKPSTDESLFWLNQAVDKFVKTRFNGDFIHDTSYEETEKRRHDLIKLYKIKSYWYEDIYVNLLEPSYDIYKIHYPEDFLFASNEDVVISDNDNNNQLNTCVFECTQDSFMYRVNNSLTDFHYRYHRARPLRVRTKYGCNLLTDKNYRIYKYQLGYIRKPQEISLEYPHEEYDDFEDTTLNEIIKIAAQMYIENKKDERYRTITQEVNTQE